MISIIEVTNGFTVSREMSGGLIAFSIFVETYEKATELVLKILEHEYAITER